MIPTSAEPADVFPSSPESSWAAIPTKAIPITINVKAKKWCGYYFLPRKMKAIPAVMITIAPLIIWYIDAGHKVKPMFIRVDPQISKHAGIANSNGLILVFNFTD